MLASYSKFFANGFKDEWVGDKITGTKTIDGKKVVMKRYELKDLLSQDRNVPQYPLDDVDGNESLDDHTTDSEEEEDGAESREEQWRPMDDDAEEARLKKQMELKLKPANIPRMLVGMVPTAHFPGSNNIS